MYRKPDPQISVYDFLSPFGKGLDSKNRWVKLARLIPWDEIEEEYAGHFGAEGAPAKPSRMAFGALLIQVKLQTSDSETVARISENPYLQYFIGLKEFQIKPPFDPSLMTHFRKRISQEIIDRVNEETEKTLKKMTPKRR